jgi:hypothetical protein
MKNRIGGEGEKKKKKNHNQPTNQPTNQQTCLGFVEVKEA